MQLPPPLTAAVAPGEVLRVGRYGAPTLLGYVDVTAGDTAVAFSPSAPPVFARTLARAALEAGGPARIGFDIRAPRVRVASSGAWTGVGNWPRESLDREWRGEFARVRFYDEALTAQQVALLQ